MGNSRSRSKGDADNEFDSVGARAAGGGDVAEAGGAARALPTVPRPPLPTVPANAHSTPPELEDTFCVYHNERGQQCSNYCPGTYCVNHACPEGGCGNSKSSRATFCQEHTPGGPKRLECEFYGANGSICGNPDVTPPSTFCSFHTCKEAGCTNSKASRDKFCLSHTRAASAEVEINFFVAGGARAATPVPAERIYGVVHTFHGMEELKRRRDTYIPYLHWVDDGIAAIIGSDPNVLHKAAGSFSQAQAGVMLLGGFDDDEDDEDNDQAVDARRGVADAQPDGLAGFAGLADRGNEYDDSSGSESGNASVAGFNDSDEDEGGGLQLVRGGGYEDDEDDEDVDI